MGLNKRIPPPYISIVNIIDINRSNLTIKNIIIKKILAKIAEDDNRVDKENVNDYLEGVRRFYIKYDYTTLNEYIR